MRQANDAANRQNWQKRWQALLGLHRLPRLQRGGAGVRDRPDRLMDCCRAWRLDGAADRNHLPDARRQRHGGHHHHDGSRRRNAHADSRREARTDSRSGPPLEHRPARHFQQQHAGAPAEFVKRENPQPVGYSPVGGFAFLAFAVPSPPVLYWRSSSINTYIANLHTLRNTFFITFCGNTQAGIFSTELPTKN